MNASIDASDVGRRYCDVVMKGGITSGVVFPAAIARLSTQFRFRNIGGTSAGAIAAAGAAAAEYRRAIDAANSGYGFARLGELGMWLGERPDGRHTRLYHLFPPEPALRRHFAILSAMLNDAIPSRQRATIISLQSLVAMVGLAIAQFGLLAIAERASAAVAIGLSGLAMAGLALPLITLLLRSPAVQGEAIPVSVAEAN